MFDIGGLKLNLDSSIHDLPGGSLHLALIRVCQCSFFLYFSRAMVDASFLKDLCIIVIGNSINRSLTSHTLFSFLKISFIWDFNFVYIENKISSFSLVLYKNQFKRINFVTVTLV